MPKHARDGTRPRTLSREAESRLFVVPLVVLATILGALAGCHPTGTPIIDPIEAGLFAGAFTVITSRAGRGTWLVFGVICVLLARGWLLLPAAFTVTAAFLSVLSARSRRRVGALIGALGVQVLLRWSPLFFHGFPSVVGAAALAMLSVSAWHRSSRKTRRWAAWAVAALGAGGVVVSVPLAVAVLAHRSEILAAEHSAKAALSTIGSGTTASVRADLEEASADANDAATSMDWWFAAGAKAVPIVAQQERFLSGTLHASAKAANVGASQAQALDYRRLDYRNGQINLARVRAIEAPMRVLHRQLVAADRAVGDALSPWLLAPLRSRALPLQRDLAQATRGAGLAIQAAKVLPAILGGDGARHYFIAFMTPSESRGLDGIIGAYGELSAVDGKVTLSRSGSVGDLDTEGVPADQRVLTGPKDFLARYGSFQPQRYAQDWTYAPDLPTVDQVVSQLYPQAGGEPIDGVLALDPYGLADLLKITGPITVPGLSEPLTSANAASFLLKDEYTIFGGQSTGTRIDFLQEALHVAFQQLVSGSLPSPRLLSQDLDPAVQTGRLAFWSNHADEQPVLRSLGLADAFPRTDGGDLLAVTTQNQGNNKLDAYLHASVNASVAFDAADGSTNSTVTITLRNDAPSSGLPNDVIASPADPGLALGTNRTWLTVYSPLSFERVTVDGVRAGMSAGEELGVAAYSMYVDVPSSSTTRVVVTLGGQLAARGTLPVTVRVQPSANPERVRITVNGTGGSALSGGPDHGVWALSPPVDQKRVFRFTS